MIYIYKTWLNNNQLDILIQANEYTKIFRLWIFYFLPMISQRLQHVSLECTYHKMCVFTTCSLISRSYEVEKTISPYITITFPALHILKTFQVQDAVTFANFYLFIAFDTMIIRLLFSKILHIFKY